MQVNLYATFRLIAGQRSLEINLPPGSTARQAVAAVLLAVPDLRAHWVNAEGELHAHVHALLTGKRSRPCNRVGRRCSNRKMCWIFYRRSPADKIKLDDGRMNVEGWRLLNGFFNRALVG